MQTLLFWSLIWWSAGIIALLLADFTEYYINGEYEITWGDLWFRLFLSLLGPITTVCFLFAIFEDYIAPLIKKNNKKVLFSFKKKPKL